MADKASDSRGAAQGNETLSGKLVSATHVAAPFQTSIRDAISTRRDAGLEVPKLVGILATPSAPSVAYAEWTKKACEEVGIEFEIWKTWDDSVVEDADMAPEGSAETRGREEQARPDMDLEADVEDLIIAANADDSIHGIMVYYPIFGGRQDTYLQQIVDPRKDVEGLHFSYCWNMYHNVRWIRPSQLGGAPGTTSEPSPQQLNASPSERRQSLSSDEAVPRGFAKSILPCTPLAIVKCLEHMGVYDLALPYGDRLYGKTITVVNRSEVVGRPLAALLSNDGARVFSIDIDSVLEFNKRGEGDASGDSKPSARKRSAVVLRAHAANSSRRLRPHHVVRPSVHDMRECLALSDVVISGVPSADFHIDTEWVPQGAVTINFSSAKNFAKDVRRRSAMHLPAIGKTTIAMLQRNLLRLVEYREMGEREARRSGGDDGDAPGGPAGPRGPGRPGPGSGPRGDGQEDRQGRPPFSGDQSATSGEGRADGGRRGGNGPSNTTSSYQPMDHEHSNSSSSDRETPRPPTSFGTDRDMSAVGAGPPHVASGPGGGAPPTLPRLGPHRGSESAAYPQPPSSFSAARGRATTLSLLRPEDDGERERLPMRPPSVSPTYATTSFGNVGPRSTSSGSTTSSGLWDWRQQSRRDSLASASTSGPSVGCSSPVGPWSGQHSHSASHYTPSTTPASLPSSLPPVPRSGAPHHATQHPSQHAFYPQPPHLPTPHGQGGAGSPLLFAPISPFGNSNQPLPPAPQYPGSRMVSRPGSTPVSPLLIDTLSVEDGPPPNGVAGAHQSMPWPHHESAGMGVSPRRLPLHLQRFEHPPSAPHVMQPPPPSVFKRPMKDLPQRFQVRSAHASPMERPLNIEEHPHGVQQQPPPPPLLQHHQHHQHQSMYHGQPQPYGQPQVQPPVREQQGAPPPPQTQDRFVHTRRRRRPPYSYSSLIAQAIASSPEGRLTLREIYQWISTAYPELYSMEGVDGQSWQNTVRHNLSLNKSFVKVARTPQDMLDASQAAGGQSAASRGKGGWWTLDTAVAHAQLGPNLKGGADEADAPAEGLGAADTSGMSGGGSGGAGGVGEDMGRAPRRRRTSSFAHSSVSTDLYAESPAPSPLFPPSVLSPATDSLMLQPGPPSAGIVPMHGGVAAAAPPQGIPSVLRRPRTLSTTQPPGSGPHARTSGPDAAITTHGDPRLSADAHGAPSTQHNPALHAVIRGRARGYTTGSTAGVEPPHLPRLFEAPTAGDRGMAPHSSQLRSRALPPPLPSSSLPPPPPTTSAHAHPLHSASHPSHHVQSHSLARTTLGKLSAPNGISLPMSPGLHSSPSKRRLRFDDDELAGAVEMRPSPLTTDHDLPRTPEDEEGGGAKSMGGADSGVASAMELDEHPRQADGRHHGDVEAKTTGVRRGDSPGLDAGKTIGGRDGNGAGGGARTNGAARPTDAAAPPYAVTALLRYARDTAKASRQQRRRRAPTAAKGDGAAARHAGDVDDDEDEELDELATADDDDDDDISSAAGTGEGDVDDEVDEMDREVARAVAAYRRRRDGKEARDDATTTTSAAGAGVDGTGGRMGGGRMAINDVLN